MPYLLSSANFLYEATLSFTTCALYHGHFSHSTLAAYFSMDLPIYQKTASSRLQIFHDFQSYTGSNIEQAKVTIDLW
jgi:hypothetical protein